MAKEMQGSRKVSGMIGEIYNSKEYFVVRVLFVSMVKSMVI